MFVHALLISYALSLKPETYFESNQFEKDCIIDIVERRYRFRQSSTEHLKFYSTLGEIPVSVTDIFKHVFKLLLVL